MTKEQAGYGGGKYCGNCGIRVDGECTLPRVEMEHCLITPGRPYWRKLATDRERLEEYLRAGRGEVVAQCTEKPEQKRGKALKRALEIINGERQDSYGNPEDSFALIGSFWTEYLDAVMGLPDGCRVTAREVAEMMALFKIARMAGQKTTFDNYADAAGYIGIAGDMV